MALKAIALNLQSNLVTSYDQTKTTLVGNVIQRVANSQNVIAPDRVRWLDVFTDAGFTPTGPITFTTNNRLFVVSGETTGNVNLALYSYSPVTQVKSFLGSVIFKVIDSPATTHTFRGLKVVDTGTTGWKVFVLTTGSVTANGGLYMINNLALADFSVGSPPTIPTATATGQKAVYKLENSPFTMTTGKGIILDTANTRVYVHNGVSATHQYYKFNYSNAISTVGANGITTDLFEFVTGNLPALSGTLLQTNSENACTPTTGVNSGQLCGFLSTVTNYYRFRLSDLTNGGTTLPSLEVINQDGAANQFTTTVPTAVLFSDTIQRVVDACTQNCCIFTKQWVNSVIETQFGIENLDYLTGLSDPFTEFGFQSIDGLASANACLAISCTTVGQRGILFLDLRSDYLYDYSYVVTPVYTVDTLILKQLSLRKNILRNSGTVIFSYRTSGFGSPTGGWIDLSGSGMVQDLTAISPTVQIQFKFRYSCWNPRLTNFSELIDGYIVADTTISENLDSVLTQLQTDHTNFQTDHTNFQTDHSSFQTDHTNFQNDHTNFQTDHSNFQADDAAFDADHTNFQSDHTNFQTDHSNFQSDHTDLEADHSNFQSDHSNFESDHADLQTDHASFQSDHSDFQDDHANFLQDHANFQADHAALIAVAGTPITKFVAIVKDPGNVLALGTDTDKSVAIVKEPGNLEATIKC